MSQKNKARLGLIISMYNELEQVKKNIESIQNNCKSIIVVQSDPKNPKKLLDKSLVDDYELLPDIAGSVENYDDEVKKGLSTIPARAVSRNYSRGVLMTKNFDIDWWICIFGDISITNLVGIEKIINTLNKTEKLLAVTRAVGQIFPDENCIFNKIQKSNTTAFMPQFFIVHSKLLTSGLFNPIQITNQYCTEQVLGDEVNRYCSEHGVKFNDLCYSICDYAYPQFIKGLSYNPDKIRMPRYVDGFVNKFRKFRADHFL